VNAEKKNREQELNKLKNITNKLFPFGKPMERVNSYIPCLAKDPIGFNQQIDVAPSLFDQKIVFIILSSI
jgi:hypothetical protein